MKGYSLIGGGRGFIVIQVLILVILYEYIDCDD